MPGPATTDRAGQPSSRSLLEQIERNGAATLRQPVRRGDAGFVETRRVEQPGARQVEAQGKGVYAVWPGVRHGHSDLAVVLAAEGVAVLPLHADGVPALFDERDLFHQQHSLDAGESVVHLFAVPATDEVLVPGALVDEVLQRLSDVLDVEGGATVQAARQADDVFPSAGGQETLHVGRCPA